MSELLEPWEEEMFSGDFAEKEEYVNIVRSYRHIVGEVATADREIMAKSGGERANCDCISAHLLHRLPPLVFWKHFEIAGVVGIVLAPNGSYAHVAAAIRRRATQELIILDPVEILGWNSQDNVRFGYYKRWLYKDWAGDVYRKRSGNAHSRLFTREEYLHGERGFRCFEYAAFLRQRKIDELANDLAGKPRTDGMIPQTGDRVLAAKALGDFARKGSATRHILEQYQNDKDPEVQQEVRRQLRDGAPSDFGSSPK